MLDDNERNGPSGIFFEYEYEDRFLVKIRVPNLEKWVPVLWLPTLITVYAWTSEPCEYYHAIRKYLSILHRNHEPLS